MSPAGGSHDPAPRSLIDAFDAFLLDIDGVLWLEGQPIPGAAAALERLRRAGKRVVFLTNKSTGSRRSIRERLAAAGFDVRHEEIINSPYATAVYLRERFGPSPVHAIGSPGVSEELRGEGHAIVDRDARFVVVGFTPTADLTRSVLARICDLLHGGARLVACNKDRGNPLPDLSVSLGSFYTVGVIERAAGIEALVIGKPHRPMFEAAFLRFGLAPERCCMVGDIIESDVAGGRNAGTTTLLVLSGVTNEAVLADSPIKPDYTLPSMAELR
jgi:HAD superfamily hydrolase (TIGR01450 family)